MDCTWAHLDGSTDPNTIAKIQSKDEESLNIFFRKLCIKAQHRFLSLFDFKTTPMVFLHGNPHIDNLVVIGNKTGLIDFDRCRHGPYAWDLVRFLGSLNMKSEKDMGCFLNKNILNATLKGYELGFLNPESPFYQIPSLLSLPTKPWQVDLKSYMQSQKKWARKIEEHAIDIKDPKAIEILDSYLNSRFIQLKDNYQIEKIGYSQGSLGHPHYVYFLKSIHANQPDLLIDLKETYIDHDIGFFTSQFKHKGVQMIAASQLYAYELEKGLGFATYQHKAYWGREIPIDKRQFSGSLSRQKLVEIALGVGTQIGRAHRLSLLSSDPAHLLRHLHQHFDLWVAIAEQINQEIRLGYESLLAEPIPSTG